MTDQFAALPSERRLRALLGIYETWRKAEPAARRLLDEHEDAVARHRLQTRPLAVGTGAKIYILLRRRFRF
jgi:hypothetical protein